MFFSKTVPGFSCGSAVTKSVQPAGHFLARGDDMAALIRATDWSKTPPLQINHL
jgi:hypothetical protein